MLGSTYHMTLKLLWNCIYGVKTSWFCHLLRNIIMDIITQFYYSCKTLVDYRFYCMALYYSQMWCHVITNIQNVKELPSYLQVTALGFNATNSIPFIYLKTLKWYFRKQWRPRWNAKECDISSESALFANIVLILGQLVIRLTTDPRVTSLIPARSHTLLEINHEIIFMVILLLPLIQEGFVVSYKRKYVHKVLVNHLVKLAQEKMWLS